MEKEGSDRADLVLIVDDDPDIRGLIGEFLGQHGLRVACAGEATEMNRAIEVERPALVVLDLMLPGEGGLSICRRLSAAKIPVIVLSALGTDTDRIVGLELGADDYLPKPCNPRELLARVRAVLRRHDGDWSVPGIGAGYRFAGWSFDPHRRELRSPGGVGIALSTAEYRLLTTFLDRPMRVLSRTQLLEHAFGPNADVFDRAVDVQVSRLRRKLDDGGSADLIVTVRSEGYMFAVKPVRQ